MSSPLSFQSARRSDSSPGMLVQLTLARGFFATQEDPKTKAPYLGRPLPNPHLEAGRASEDAADGAGGSSATGNGGSNGDSSINDNHTSKPSGTPSSTYLFSKEPSPPQPDVEMEAPADQTTRPPRQHARNMPGLIDVYLETKNLLPGLLRTIPTNPPSGQSVPVTGTLCPAHELGPLPRDQCPRLPPTAVHVINYDCLDAALELQQRNKGPTPVLVLNMANAARAGGGWTRGCMAQEESLCYRTSLSFTLKNRFYPLKVDDAVYSPLVFVIRESVARGHGLVDLTKPAEFRAVSVVSVAAVRDPEVVVDEHGQQRYRWQSDRRLMTTKIRNLLRLAGRERHRILVLGALGCGAFGNPRNEVVAIWQTVLKEPEFAGWWEAVVFAVMEKNGSRDDDGNFGVFWRGLDGLLVDGQP